ncbi:MAG: hypothetical protein K0S65_662, partial [Labilithrix sp.]|nr:hypothetical protein [Labilithrix sp.]
MMGTRTEDEERLEAFVQGAREEPDAGELEALERRLEPWLAAPPPRRLFGPAAARTIVLVVLGLGLVAVPLHTLVSRNGVPTTGPVAPVVTAPAAPHATAESPPAEPSVSVLDLPSAPVLPAPPKTSKERSPSVRSSSPNPLVVAPPAPSAEERAETEGSFLRRTQSALVSD